MIFDTLLGAIGVTICAIAIGLFIKSTSIVALAGVAGLLLIGWALFLTGMGTE